MSMGYPLQNLVYDKIYGVLYSHLTTTENLNFIFFSIFDNSTRLRIFNSFLLFDMILLGL